MRIIFVLALILPFQLLAEEKNWKLSTGVFYLSDRIYRGAIIWPAASVMPMLGISYRNISINGPGFQLNLPYHKFTFQTGLQYFNDGPPLIPLQERKKDFRNQRKGVYDATIGLGWEFWPRFRLNLSAAKAINSHYGFYSLASLQIPLVPFVSAGYALALADTRANRYAYGPEAVAGLAHRDFNISLVLPFLPGKGVLITKYTTSRIHQAANKNASYVRPSDKPAALSSMATWNF